MESPEFYHTNTYSSEFTSDKHHSLDSKTNNGDRFVVEDLLDFSNDNDVVSLDGTTAQFETLNANSTDSSTITPVDNSCNSSFTGGSQFSGGDLCVPYDELAELEWLSNFVEEDSFSSEDLQKLQLISGSNTRPIEPSVTRPYQPEPDGQLLCYDSSNNASFFNPETVSVPAKARSKRSRAISCNWASRLLMLAPTTSSIKPDLAVTVAQRNNKTSVVANNNDMGEVGSNGDGRKCLHCATDKTPQWRTGPMGPKTLCNACGVRYKSGRLVPEYRPASSPTFVLTKHSNSHRKVLELRRQKDMVRAHQHQQQQFLTHHQSMMYEVSNGDDCLIHHQHGAPDYRRLI